MGRSRSAGPGGGGRWGGVVFAGSLEDGRVDQGERILLASRSGRLDHRVHPTRCCALPRLLDKVEDAHAGDVDDGASEPAASVELSTLNVRVPEPESGRFQRLLHCDAVDRDAAAMR